MTHPIAELRAGTRNYGVDLTVFVRISMEEMHELMTQDQIEAVVRGIAMVVAAGKPPARLRAALEKEG